MSKNEPKEIDSVLDVKSIASLNASSDLTLKDGKTIEELLNAQEKEAENSTEQCD